MSLLKNLKTDASIQGEQDRIGGGGAIESNVYDLTIDMAYITVSEEKTDGDGKVTGGAMAVTIIYKQENGKEITDTQYVTGGADKGKKNTYLDKDKNEQYLPGFLIMDAVAMLTLGKSISDLETEDKLVEVYDFQAKAKVAKKLPVITELIGKKLVAGILRVVANKKVKQQNGSYAVTNDKSTFNEVSKIFCARDDFKHMTVAEIRAKKADPSVTAKFYDEWKNNYAGKDKDTFKPVDGAPAGTSGGSQTASGATAPKTSLFG